MSKKRRKDSDHDIGDSSPGTIGDKQTDNSNETPMDRIHKRRHGNLSIPEPSDGKEPNDQDKEDEGGFDELGIPTNMTHPDDGDSE